MRTSLTIVVCLALLAATIMPAVAADKEVTLSGKLTCAKCDLKKDTKCATVLVTKEGGQDAVYYLEDKTGKAKHTEFCQTAKEGTVTGKVSEKDGKKTITASKVELKK